MNKIIKFFSSIFYNIKLKIDEAVSSINPATTCSGYEQTDGRCQYGLIGECSYPDCDVLKMHNLAKDNEKRINISGIERRTPWPQEK